MKSAKENATQRDRHPTRGAMMALAAGVCGGVIGATVSAANGVLPATELLFFRFLVASVLLLIPCWRILPLLTKKTSLPIWIAALSGACSAACYFNSLQMMSVGTAIMISNISLLFIILLSAFFLGERLESRKLVGVAVMVISLVVLSIDRANAPSWTGFLVALLGAGCLSVCSVAIRVATIHSPAALIVFVFSATTALVAGGMPSEPWAPVLAPKAIMFVGVAVVAGTLANLLSVAATRQLNAGVVSALTKTTLVWGVLLGWALTGDAPPPLHWTAFLLVIVAVILIQNLRLPTRRSTMTLKHEYDLVAVASSSNLIKRLRTAVLVAEELTSCEFRFHVNVKSIGDVESDAKAFFDRESMRATALRNGILLAHYQAAAKTVVIFDGGIVREFPKKELRDACESLLTPSDESFDFADVISDRIPEFAVFLSQRFPIGDDDINELSDEVSLVI